MRGRSAGKKASWSALQRLSMRFFFFFLLQELHVASAAGPFVPDAHYHNSVAVALCAKTKPEPPEPSHPAEVCRRARRRLLVSEGDKHSDTSSGERRLRRRHCALPHFTWWLVLQSAPLFSPASQAVELLSLFGRGLTANPTESFA